MVTNRSMARVKRHRAPVRRRLFWVPAIWVVGAMLLQLGVVIPAQAASSGMPTVGFGMGGGRPDCAEVKRKVLRNWFDVQSIMRGENADKKGRRPKSREFSCFSRQYLRGAIPKTIPGLRGELDCYKLNGRGACCDDKGSCVSL